MTELGRAVDSDSPTPAVAPKVALIGFMGAGKSTAARALGPGSIDVDAVIEAREGRSVQEIFASDGEGSFRELEERVTLELLTDPEVQTLALGGGAVTSSRIREALERTRVVWLDVELDQAWERVGSTGSRAPAGARPGALRAALRTAAARV